MRIIKKQMFNLYVRLAREIEGEIIEVLREVGAIHANYISNRIGYSWHCVKAHLDKLISMGVVKRTGPDIKHYKYEMAKPETQKAEVEVNGDEG